jgi:NAD(P)H-flavin reductase
MGAISFCSVEVRSVFRFQVLRCGPPPMNKAMAAHLDDLGYTKEMQFQF